MSEVTFQCAGMLGAVGATTDASASLLEQPEEMATVIRILKNEMVDIRNMTFLIFLDLVIPTQIVLNDYLRLVWPINLSRVAQNPIIHPL